ncbi:MAG: helix-turn-helix transcriptional regulator [Clostridia bacterium]|nr:helix-turn-helix transcriptional regulator [Clostridia bacterium]
MLDQKIFGEKLRNHRKTLGMTQEEVAEKIGVSAQAVSKWEAGDCLPDLFNLKAITDLYKISADVILETESDGDIDAVAGKIEQLGTEFIWANSKESKDRYGKNPHTELGNDLWQMWKGIYFAEVGNREMQAKDKAQGNTRICGSYGMKIWDDDGIACVAKSSLIKSLPVYHASTQEVINAICSEDGQKLITALKCHSPMPKKEIIEKTGIEIHRLNELLLLFTESKIIEYISDCKVLNAPGYKISGHCGIAAYMVLAAMYIMNKKNYTVSEYLFSDEND